MKEYIAPLDDDDDDDADDYDIADTEMASHSFAIVFRSFVYFLVTGISKRNGMLSRNFWRMKNFKFIW